MPAKRCPKCGLVNPAKAERCDCGRSFADGSMGAPLARKESAEDAAYRKKKPMLIVALVGISLVMVGMGLAKARIESLATGLVIAGLLVIRIVYIVWRRSVH